MRQAEPVSTTSSARPAALSAARRSAGTKIARAPQPSTRSSVGAGTDLSEARLARVRSSARTTAWNVARAEDLTLESLEALKAAPAPTELLVLGCGARAIFVPPALRAELKAAGLALEVVDTGSACRIYNVLLAESRRVAAALIPL